MECTEETSEEQMFGKTTGRQLMALSDNAEDKAYRRELIAVLWLKAAVR